MDIRESNKNEAAKVNEQQELKNQVAQLTLYECYPGGPIVTNRKDCLNEDSKTIQPNATDRFGHKPEAPSGKAQEQRFLPDTTIKM